MTSKKTTNWVKSLGGQFLLCRGLRHQWEPTGNFRGLTGEERQRVRGTVGYSQVVQLLLVCQRCSTNRIDLYGRTSKSQNNGGTFVKIRGRYVYPKGYGFDTREYDDRPRSTDYYNEMYRRLS